MASGTIIMTNASVSSLMPNTAPNKLNRIIIKDITTLFTPTMRNSPYFSTLRELRKKDSIPVSIARLLFIIWKAPPIISRNTIIPACFSNPSSNTPKTCQLCGGGIDCMKGVIYNNRTFRTVDHPYFPGVFTGRNNPGKGGTYQDYNRYNCISMRNLIQFHSFFRIKVDRYRRLSISGHSMNLFSDSRSD